MSEILRQYGYELAIFLAGFVSGGAFAAWIVSKVRILK